LSSDIDQCHKTQGGGDEQGLGRGEGMQSKALQSGFGFIEWQVCPSGGRRESIAGEGKGRARTHGRSSPAQGVMRPA
jgi:hypothetical protein